MEVTRNEVATSARQNVEYRFHHYNNIIIRFAEGCRCICKLMCKLSPTSGLSCKRTGPDDLSCLCHVPGRL